MKQDNQAFEQMTSAGLQAAHALIDSFGQFARATAAANPLLATKQSSCCDIPPACWLPRNLGELDSNACPCGTALVRFQITNCQPQAGEITVSASVDDKLGIKITPERTTLEAMERKWFTVAATIPEDVCKDECFDVLIWIRGCNEHYLRWTVKVAEGMSGSCHEVKVEDCPDYQHHWYDHFYCARPCFAPARKTG